jgi:O-Antigen ligase
MNNHPGQLPDILVRLLVVAAMTVLTIYAVTQQNTRLIIFVLAAAPVVALINRPEAFVILIIGLSHSALLLPGFPRGLQVMHLLMAGFIPVMVARFTILKSQHAQTPVSFRLVWLMLLWLLFIIYERGLGFRSGGEGLIGGASYIKFYLCAGFLLCSRYITLTSRQWRLTIWLLVFGSFIPIIAEQLFIQSGGTILFQYMFIEPYVSGLIETLDARESGTSIARLTAFTGAASSLLMAALVLTSHRNKFRFITYCAIGVCILFAGLSGFRSLIVEITALAVLFRIMIAPRKQRPHLIMLTGLLALVVLVVIIPLISSLPLPMQRALSWLPFAEVDIMARTGAEQSTEWRFRLWKYVWENAGDYLWVGRGFSVSMPDLMSSNYWNDDILYFWFGHNYHNGPLSAIVDTGVIGFLLLLGIFASVSKSVLSSNIPESDDLIYLFHTFIKVKILYSILAFLLIFGDVRSTVPTLFVYLAIFYALEASNNVVQSRKSALKTPGGSEPEKKRARQLHY